jgi:elongation factor Ts
MEITAAMVKELRSQSGAGIMECKSALKETQGDLEEAITFLRKKGLAKADKKSDRQTSEGVIGSYIHQGSKVGVMLELNCETDFVANTPDFQTLVKDIAMHIAAAKPRFATREEVTEVILEKEREIFAHQAKESGKPENIIEKIVTGKMEKFYEENCVLEQPFIKDTNVTIGELIKQKNCIVG